MRFAKGMLQSALTKRVTVSLSREAVNQKIISFCLVAPTIYVIILTGIGHINEDAKMFWVRLNNIWAGNFVGVIPGLNQKVHDLAVYEYIDRAYMLSHCYAVSVLWPVLTLPFLIFSLVSRLKIRKIFTVNPLNLKNTMLPYTGGVVLVSLTFFMKPNLWDPGDRYSRLLSYHVSDFGLILEIFFVSAVWSSTFLMVFSNFSAIMLTVLKEDRQSLKENGDRNV
jgi:hypothetical protein